MNIKDLNLFAMQIITHAGDCRNLVNEALCLLEKNEDYTVVDKKMDEAHKQITEAHKIQTKVIQETILDENFYGSLLFTHAQDTLMTINSEYLTAKNLIALYKKMEEKLKNV